jgi:CelD/BcsL family acetyltransferase involved in cellulose biosynthesis
VTIDADIFERTEIVRSADRLAEIAAAWTTLWQRSDGLVFQSHSWVAAWWSAAPDRDRLALRIGLVWRGDELAAIVPLAISRRQGVRLLEWAASAYTDYGDILKSADCSEPMLVRLWRDLQRSGGFDIVALNRLLPDAAARSLIGASADGSMKLRPNYREEASFRVAGPFTTGAAWLESQSKKTRQNYRRGYKALEENGPVTFRIVPAEDDLGPLLERLAQFKRAWLRNSGRQSDNFDAGTATLAALVAVLRDAGLLRVFVLECAGEMVAVSLNFVQRNTMMAFVTTYDPAFERGSPGMLLMIDYIRWSIDNGLELVDFLCGAEPFKLRFANQSVTLGTVTGSRTTLGEAATLVDGLRHRYRQWRKRRSEVVAAGSSSPEPEPVSIGGQV